MASLSRVLPIHGWQSLVGSATSMWNGVNTLCWEWWSKTYERNGDKHVTTTSRLHVIENAYMEV